MAASPNYRSRLALSQSLELQCRINEAVEVLDGLLAEQPDNPDLWEQLAQVLGRAFRFGRAVEAHEQAIRRRGENPRLWLEYALTLRFAGRQADAMNALRRSLELDASYGPAWWVISTMAPETITADDVQLIERAIAQSSHHQITQFMHIALGTVFDNRGEFERAFRHFAAGKVVRSATTRYNPSRLEALNSGAMELSDRQFFDQREGFGAASKAPIFIVGLPRSGSTLIERILGGHSKIEAAGELPIVPSLIRQLDAEAGRVGGHRDLLSKLSADRTHELGELYLLRSLEYRRTEEPLFIDKLHMNWLNLAFIRLVLPDARIIDVRRNALDCCWSNFKILFTSGHPAADNLDHIGRFYREYVRMMDHAAGWGEARILRLSYEALVNDIEGETRRVLEFLGLEFEPACLDFHKLEGPVATQSAEQVRRPLNSEGIGRWKPYREWLGPLFDALGPLATEEE